MKGQKHQLIWERCAPTPRIFTADAGSYRGAGWEPSFFTSRLVCGLLAQVGLYDTQAEAITRRGIEVLREIGSYLPLNGEEQADLLMLGQFGPPASELYWKWCDALMREKRRITEAHRQRMARQA